MREGGEREEVEVVRRGESGGRELVVGSWADISSAGCYLEVPLLPTYKYISRYTQLAYSWTQATVQYTYMIYTSSTTITAYSTTLSGKYVTIPTQLYLYIPSFTPYA